MFRLRLLKITLFISVSLFLVVMLVKGKIVHQAFDSSQWKEWEETEEQWSLRWDMMNDLRNSYDLKNMSKLEVIDLLGKPSSDSENRLVYYLGASKRGINMGYLEIRYDSALNVSSFMVKEH